MSYGTYEANRINQAMIGIGFKFQLNSDQYTVVEEKGRGGFGAVFRAQRDSSKPTSENIAVKVLLPEHANDKEWSERFGREARILANINHMNVVRIRGMQGLADGSMAILQDYVEDALDMREAFRKFECEVQKSLSVVLQVLYGLRASHNCPGGGAIHRDLSPGNILVDGTGRARIIDFGLARRMVRKSGSVLSLDVGRGTPGITPPEQRINFADVDHRGDLFSLGRSIAASYQDREPDHADCGILPQPWRDFCLRLTAYDREKRPANCDEAVELLLSAFADYVRPDSEIGISPVDMPVHLAEMKFWDDKMPASWPRMVRRHIYHLKGDSWDHYNVMSQLTLRAVLSRDFDLNGMFLWFETEIVEKLFGGKFTASFSSTDKLGEMLLSWMPHLESTNRLLAFTRLVRTAVRYHRYELMEMSRNAYSAEHDATAKAQFLKVLNAEDPTGIIQGRGIIPGRQ